MKWLFRILAVIFLLTTVLVSLARRENSGWIAFTPVGNYASGILLMTGDGSDQMKLSNPDAILQHDEPFAPRAPSLRAVRDSSGEVIHIMAANEEGAQRVTLDPTLRYVNEPIWSPDGEWIAFLSGETAGEYIYRIRSDGRDLQRLTQRASDLIGLRWSPDGEWLLVARVHQRFADIVRVRADGSSLEILSPGIYPEYAPVSGLGWHPVWLAVACLMLLVASVFGRSHS